MLGTNGFRANSLHHMWANKHDYPPRDVRVLIRVSYLYLIRRMGLTARRYDQVIMVQYDCIPMTFV